MPGLGREGEVELLWQWLICERGWLLRVSLGSLVYFFKAGVCFLISKALLCSFPNKSLKKPPLPHPSLLCPPSAFSLWKQESPSTSQPRGPWGRGAGVLGLLVAACSPPCPAPREPG